ncbi:penicillin-binding transpeptidase domain-containing protein [Vescimonas sanitatis]|uniref:penicillin-binding transpeptidase domain-containing protein n=1 Tax=Vescimonas sanitatis TaxID=3376993 RepID=UPI003B7E82CC
MMKNPHPSRRRVYVLLGFFCAFLVLFFAVLYDAQVVHGSENRARSITSNTASETVTASRGIITDRNGKVLVSNRLAYTLVVDKSSFGKDEAALNDAIWQLIQLCQEQGVTWNDTLPMTTGSSPQLTSKSLTKSFREYLDDNKLPTDGGSAEVLAAMRKLYKVDDSYTNAQARLIVGVRYELDGRSSYTFAEDVSTELLGRITDGKYRGVTIKTAAARVYNTKLAAHILGTVGAIWQEEWRSDESTGYVGYADKGYNMNDLVGKDGVEKAFEEYLHGKDGKRLITTDENGKITGELYTREPQPGGTVALTIDIDLQQVVEDTLASTIQGMIDKDSNERGGAAAVIQVGTGEVLAMASYPTYDLETFNQDYDELVKDERLPMFNRATQGVYAPGSTFKLCTSVAALEEGIITPSTIIEDKGIYTYYVDPQPMCWIWRQAHTTHGRINVSQAIVDSCNYFYYEVGRLTGIKKLDEYATAFGLGQSTGIEIGDVSGVLASPEWAEAHDREWTDGQTITAAIGQSYNLFTPLQLANYVATLVSGGEHYEAHLLKNVKSYDNSRVIDIYGKGPLNDLNISDSTMAAVTKGMHDLTYDSLRSAFSRCVVEAGAKTGSAQVGTDIANGTFVAYAPYDDPEIAIAIVVEKGGSGSLLANAAVDIINAWFTRDGTGATAAGEDTLMR